MRVQGVQVIWMSAMLKGQLCYSFLFFLLLTEIFMCICLLGQLACFLTVVYSSSQFSHKVTDGGENDSQFTFQDPTLVVAVLGLIAT